MLEARAVLAGLRRAEFNGELVVVATYSGEDEPRIDGSWEVCIVNSNQELRVRGRHLAQALGLMRELLPRAAAGSWRPRTCQARCRAGRPRHSEG